MWSSNSTRATDYGSGTDGTITIVFRDDGTNSHATNFTEGPRHNGRNGIVSVPNATEREKRVAPVRIITETLPMYFPSYKGLGGDQYPAPIYRVFARKGRTNQWTGRNFKRVEC